MPRLLPLLFALVFVAACSGPAAVVEPEPVPEPVAEADPLAEPLPLDPTIRDGVLPNGLRYFIRRNAEPRERAELRLVVDAGSILEEDDQRGLAHLLEHMAFNGTERFPEQELVRFLESIGTRFGPDLNAYTSFDETVYMLQLPTDGDRGLLYTGLEVLREWAGSITLDPAAIDAERGVVLEEWRVGQGAGSRLRDQQFPILFAGSRYAERLPIGVPEVITGAPYARIEAFYRDWYRPDLMTVVAVGDFEVEDIEARIQALFSDLETPADAPERPAFDVPRHEDTRFALAADPEQPNTVVQLIRKIPAEPMQTQRDLRNGLVQQLYDVMMQARLREITQRPGAPFTFAATQAGSFVRPTDFYASIAVAPDGGVPAALEALVTEARRVRLHGFTPTEFDRAQADLLRAYERAYEERETTASRVYAGRLVEHALSGEAVPGIVAEYALVQELLPTIELAEVDAVAERANAPDNRVVLVSAPQTEPLPSEDALRAVLDAAEAREIEPYVDEVPTADLMATPPRPGRVLDQSVYEASEVIEWRLSNGARVILRPTDFRADEVLFRAFAPGGTSLVEDDRLRAAQQATAAVATGGVADFRARDLERLLAGQAVQVQPYLSSTEQGLSGSASPRDLETLLQLVHLHFTAPRADAEAFTAYQERAATQLRNRSLNPMTAFVDTLTVTLAQGHPRSRPLTAAEVEAVALRDALGIYRERFADPAAFTFVLVGALDPEAVQPLVQRYLASLPGASEPEEARDLGIRPPSGVVERVVRRGMEPQATVAVVFHGDMPEATSAADARRERYLLSALGEALAIRLREEIREERGGSYGVGVNASVDRLAGTYQLLVNFGTDPERVDELVEALLNEVAAFQADGPPAETVATVREQGRRGQETSLRENRAWLGAITEAYRYDEDPMDYLDRDDLRQLLTPQAVRRAAQRYLDVNQRVQVVRLPEAE